VTGPTVAAEELVVHAFIVMDDVTGDGPYQLAHRMWWSCLPLMGQPITVAGRQLPEHPPEDAADLPDESVEEAVIAAQQSSVGDMQALLRRRHDVLNLSVAFTPNTDQLAGWREFERRWERLVDDSSAGLLGEARVYYGKVSSAHALPLPATADMADAVRGSLPPGPHEPGWERTGVTTVDGFPVWELSPRDDSRRLRKILVLTPENHDERLSAWVWSDGNPAMPLFARYLMHAAKMRHQARLWDRGRSLGGLRARAADIVARLRAADSRPSRDSVWDVELDVASALATLPAMKHTVEIAADNMSRTLAGAVPVGEGRDLFADDHSLSKVFPTWLDDEIEYLQLDRDLLREASSIVADSRSHHTDAAPTRASRRADAEPSVGILTAMPVEFHAMRALLDDRHDAAVPVDRAHYVRGVLPSHDPEWPHRVVLAQTGATGTTAAADAATNMYRSFPSVTCLVMTGIAAGVPDPANPLRHVRLGDIVVATWGIVDYDHVVVTDGGKTSLRATFPRPWNHLCRVADLLEADEYVDQRPWEQWLDVTGKPDLARYQRPPDNTDRLAPTGPDGSRPRHPHRTTSGHRPGWPKVHKGLIGSANTSLRDAALRDRLAAEHNMRAIEMEGAGVGTSAFLNDRHWFMVRGISDYADSSYGHHWRPYAALAAAAYVRALLATSPPLTTP
jgi:nucleoside phosphorylase